MKDKLGRTETLLLAFSGKDVSILEEQIALRTEDISHCRAKILKTEGDIIANYIDIRTLEMLIHNKKYGK